MADLIEIKETDYLMRFDVLNNLRDDVLIMYGGIKNLDYVKGVINNLPSADTERHAHWIISFNNTYGRKQCFCSSCGKKSSVAGINQEVPYCHWCGCKMDEKV